MLSLFSTLTMKVHSLRFTNRPRHWQPRQTHISIHNSLPLPRFGIAGTTSFISCALSFSDEAVTVTLAYACTMPVRHRQSLSFPIISCFLTLFVHIHRLFFTRYNLLRLPTTPLILALFAPRPHHFQIHHLQHSQSRP